MIKHSALLSVIALLILAFLFGGCISPAGAPLVEPAVQSADESSGSQSITEVLTQDEGATPAEDSDTGKVLDQVEQHAEDAAFATPELIELAYAVGEIDAEERVLYLTYAIYEYESLPLAYQSDEPWRGTMIVLELDEFRDSPEFCELPSDVQSELERLLGESSCTS